MWIETELENIAYPKYLGVTLDRLICYKQHIQNTKMKVATSKNILTNKSKYYQNVASAFSYPTAAYAAPVWARSPHAKNLDPGLTQACRSVTGCLKLTNVEDLYLLSGIAPPAIRIDVCATVERQNQLTRKTQSLFGHIPVT